MSDPLRTDESRAHDAAPDAERDAKIEQLLLVGLDHYFVAQYEDAINVWTRALFLDRTHARARAYIERARSALAERQRESEELLQHGVAAFHRGDGEEARRLLQAAIDGGAPADEALAVLDRLDRREAPGPLPTPRVRRGLTPPPPRRLHQPARYSTGTVVAMAAGVGLLALVALVLGTSSRVDWWSVVGLQDPPAVRTAPLARDTSLPLPRRGEVALGRARILASGGHLRDALAALDAVRPTDPQKPDADRLRADIQRQLLALVTLPAAGGEKGGRPVP